MVAGLAALALALGASPAPAPEAASEPASGSASEPASGTAHEPSPGPAAPPAEAPAPVVRSSDPLVEDDVAWDSEGLRFQLLFGYGLAAGWKKAPSMQQIVLGVRGGYRFDQTWGLMGNLRYIALREGLSGMRWTATVEPELHLWGFTLVLGGGYAGIIGDRVLPEPIDYPAYVAPPDLIDLSGGPGPGRLPPFAQCDGDGVAAVARLSYLFVVGPLFATGPMVELDGQWTLCTDHGFEGGGSGFGGIFGGTPEETRADARIAIPKQWWAHFAADLVWVFAWR